MTNEECDRCFKPLIDEDEPDKPFDRDEWLFFGELLCIDCLEIANDELMASEGHEGDAMAARFFSFLGVP